jgi:hypothetical protein
LAVVLHRLNWVLRGWANYFRHGAAAKTFAYLDAFSWRRVMRWLCRKHPRIGWRVLCRHVKILPGRKTDVADAAWLAELLEHGLLRGSFGPPAAIRELRDLTRYRKRLIQAHGAEVQRVQKTLEDAGIKLDSVAAEVVGGSGRAMLAALVRGERDPRC